MHHRNVNHRPEGTPENSNNFWQSMIFHHRLKIFGCFLTFSQACVKCKNRRF